MSIPKIIHYFYDDINIWEKNTKSQVRMCVNSWLQYCPNYKLMLWHDKMPEFKEIISKSKFAQRAYELKLWAFVADYIRFYALKKYGGIYLDTDVQLLHNFDKYLNNKFFCSIELDVLDNENVPEPAVMGAIPNHPLCNEVLSIYESDDIFSIDKFIANVITKKALNNLYGFKYINFSNSKDTKHAISLYKEAPSLFKLNDYNLYRSQRLWQDKNKEVSIYPSEYFCPSWSEYKTKAFTENTVAIHWNQSSWWNTKKIQKLKNDNKSRSLLHHFFSIEFVKKHKIVTVLGLKLKIKRKQKNA